MSSIVRIGSNYKSLGTALMIIGLFLFFCHRLNRSIDPESFHKFFPDCEGQADIFLNGSERKLTLRDDCWSGAVNAGKEQTIYSGNKVPEHGIIAVKCANSKVIFLSDKNYSCSRPIRYKAVNVPTIRVTLADYDVD